MRVSGVLVKPGGVVVCTGGVVVTSDPSSCSHCDDEGSECTNPYAGVSSIRVTYTVSQTIRNPDVNPCNELPAASGSFLVTVPAFPGTTASGGDSQAVDEINCDTNEPLTRSITASATLIFNCSAGVFDSWDVTIDAQVGGYAAMGPLTFSFTDYMPLPLSFDETWMDGASEFTAQISITQA